jgi:CRP-like cAMP-binding protein
MSNEKEGVNPEWSINKERFLSYVKTIETITHADSEAILSLIKLKSYKKDHILIREGELSNNEFFITEGIVKALFIDEQGNEKITAFYPGQNFIGTNALRTKQNKSIYTFQTLTKTTTLIFNSLHFMDLIKDSPKLMSLASEVKELEISRQNRRERTLMQVHASDKYEQFIEDYPNLEEIVPHYNIASYLGITPVTLSRIKNKK